MNKGADQKVIGFDIDEVELSRAPEGSYDSYIVGDIGSKALKKPKQKADLVICQVVLEHVKNTDQAIKNMAINTRKGGRIILFVPSKHALFAQINRILPQAIKEKVLYSIFPESVHAQGFPVFYNQCSANEMKAMLVEADCSIESEICYYQGRCFSFLHRYTSCGEFTRHWHMHSLVKIPQTSTVSLRLRNKGGVHGRTLKQKTA